MASSQAGLWLILGVMLIGLVGTVLPGVPGVLLIWAAALVYALAGGFTTLSPLTLVALTILAVIGTTADLWVSHVVGRAGGASGRALLAGMLLGLLGLVFGFLFGGIGAVPGALVGSIAGIVLVEYRRRRDWRGAARAGAGWLIGYVVSALVEFMIGLAMIAIFAWQTGARLI